MLYIWLIMLILLNSCLLMLNFFALPGNWLIITATGLFAWWRAEDGVFSIYILVTAIILATFGEVVEFLGGMGGAKRAGAGWTGAFGALGGAVTGAILGTVLIPVPFLGTMIGACTGAGIGAWFIEHVKGKKLDQSIRSGLGAGVGMFVGTTVKFILGILIWLIIAIAAFWP